MGEVWLAEQIRPVHRQVALKIIKAGMDTAQVVARFEAERQALALMDHSAIARVFDAGASPLGRPYFAMEYVRGKAITAYAIEHKLTIPDRIDLFLQVCEGVQHAHQKGIIHRDLKPSNVLVTVRDDHPVLKIIDFGVAKATTQALTDRTLHTEFGALIGTPEYMSPEQAEMGGVDIDTGTDVYALGVILYELLTGTLPFESKALRDRSLDEIRRTVREVDPPRPSTRVATITALDGATSHRNDDLALAKKLRGDLDWIAMKALEKDRTRRYQTVNGLARDLQRHLNGDPVEAAAPSKRYRMGKFIKKHRAWLMTAASFVLLLVLAVLVSSVMAIRASRAEQEARALNEFLQKDLLAQASANKQAGPETNPDPDLKVRTALDRAAMRIQGRFAAQPLIEASIRHTIGATYMDLGLYSSAERQLIGALELRQHVLGERSADTLAVVTDLGDVYTYEGKYAEAQNVLTKGLDVARSVLGESDPKTMLIMNNLGLAYWRDGKYSQSEPFYVRALQLRRKISGEDAPETLQVANNLASLYYRQNKFTQAEPMLMEILNVRRRILGNEHPQTLISLNNLAMTYRAEHRYAEAEPLFVTALNLRRRVLGDEHPDTLRSFNNLGLIFRDLGKYAEAERLFTQALGGRRKALGEHHPDTISSMNELAVLCEKWGKLPEAAEWHRLAAEAQMSK
jgi:non-specific serine/threonine protein kinase/serine/threonine-protein kinase